MAHIHFDGIEFLEGQFERLGRETIKRLVMAGAGAAEKLQREEIAQRQHVRTGDMLKSVGTNEYREMLGGGRVDVYPQDDDRHGNRNATKAYVINYGKGRRPMTKRNRRNRTGDKFITGNEGKTEQAVHDAMQAESDRLIDETNQ